MAEFVNLSFKVENTIYQRLTLRLLGKGPKRSFDKKNSGQKQHFWLKYILFWAPSLKNLGAESNPVYC